MSIKTERHYSQLLAKVRNINKSGIFLFGLDEIYITPRMGGPYTFMNHNNVYKYRSVFCTMLIIRKWKVYDN